jgi:hypothetical protein
MIYIKLLPHTDQARLTQELLAEGVAIHDPVKGMKGDVFLYLPGSIPRKRGFEPHIQLMMRDPSRYAQYVTNHFGDVAPQPERPSFCKSWTDYCSRLAKPSPRTQALFITSDLSECSILVEYLVRADYFSNVV